MGNPPSNQYLTQTLTPPFLRVSKLKKNQKLAAASHIDSDGGGPKANACPTANTTGDRLSANFNFRTPHLSHRNEQLQLLCSQMYPQQFYPMQLHFPYFPKSTKMISDREKSKNYRETANIRPLT